jgi:spore coat polysaccharide biosynthesis protein SpsF
MNFKTLAIIQARMASSRLPGKVLRTISGKPMLMHVVERTSRARTVDQVVVATTQDRSDDPVAALCQREGYAHYRGSAQDVLDRYYQAGRKFGGQLIVRITADCPVIDPQVIDATVRAFLGQGGQGPAPNQDPQEISAIPGQDPRLPWDFAANRLPSPWGRTYPIGLDAEVCSFAGLKLAWGEAALPHQREHVMPFFYEQPQRFRILHVNYQADYGHMRWTVDTPQDLQLVRRIFEHFQGRENFTWLEVLDLFVHQPELARINAGVQHKNYRDVDQRDQEVGHNR